MLQTALPAVDERAGWDPSELHSALSSACSTLDVLQICDSHLPGANRTVWTVCAARPFPCAFAYGPAPVGDADLCELVARAPDVCDPASCNLEPPGCQSLLCRWQSPYDAPASVDHDRMVQVPLLAGGALYGVAQAVPLAGAPEQDSLPEVLRAASVHLVLSLERMGGVTLLDPLTGLWSAEEFRRRVDVEVERAHAYPAEFSLVLMEVRMGSDREKGCLTEAELRAVGEVLVDCLRRSDSAARLEDGRFGLLLPMTCQRDSFIAVARVTDRLREHPELSANLQCGIGVSGWAFEGSSGHELFRQASTALENAKSAGARGAFVFL